MQPHITDAAAVEEATKLLTFIDTKEINDLDPCLSDNHHVYIETDFPVTIKLKGMEK